MKTAEIKAALNLDENWKRARKVKDDKSNIIREFINEDDSEKLIVVTDQSDENIIKNIRLNVNLEILTEELKDSEQPWSKFVFCYFQIDDEPFFYITEYLYWKNNGYMSDWGGGLLGSQFDDLGLFEESEGQYSSEDPEDTKNKMLILGLFIEDPDFTKFIEGYAE